MQLTILGSGTCIPAKKRNAPGYFLKIGKKNILIDSGSGILRQMKIANIDYTKLDYMIYSHNHPDHISDLMAILQSILVTSKFIGPLRKKQLTLLGTTGFRKIYQDIRASQEIPREPYHVNIKILKDINRLNDFKIETIKVYHSDNSFAFKFIYKDKVFVYTGDADYSEKLIKFCKNADLLVTDCSFPNQKKMKGHMIAGECGLLAQKANVKKLVLSHLYPICEKYNIKKQAQKKYQRPVIIAKDLMKIKI